MHEVAMVWFTNYHAHEISPASRGPAEDDSKHVALRDASGNYLGYTLSLEAWCLGSTEGTLYLVPPDGPPQTFNYGGTVTATKTRPLPDCRQWYRKNAAAGAAAETVAYNEVKESANRFGLGQAPYRLIPFRSIATDHAGPNPVKLGALLYVPALVGTPIMDDNGKAIADSAGRPMLHDGFVFSADRGGGVLGRHIDFFVGPRRSDSSMCAITNNKIKDKTAKRITYYQAFLVDDPALHAAFATIQSRGVN
jgi:3D (Asp-Asp-Asp) domain-containing protein